MDKANLFTRRAFINGLGAAAGTLHPWIRPLALGAVGCAAERASKDPEIAARDEDFWRPVQEAYRADRALLNLNNGGVSPFPRMVEEALFDYTREALRCPSRFLLRDPDPPLEAVRRELASMFGSEPDEIAIVRNSTEALETVTFGLDLRKGDEILSSNQDYPRMVNAWKQRAMRDGVVFRQISLPAPPRDLSEIVAAFERAITPRTRVLHFCHVINLTGQILPVRELCELARSRGILSLVDGAHSFAHFPFQWKDLGCDFFGTSLHKWLSAPFGSGMLFVKKSRIRSLWPLFAHSEPRSGDIRKFEQIGTHPTPIYHAIAHAIDFNRSIGLERKAARLRYLKSYWADLLPEDDRVKFHTSFEPEQSCAIALLHLQGVPSKRLADHLRDDHAIIVAPIQHQELRGIRVSPHVYTTLAELNRFAGAIHEVLDHGLPEPRRKRGPI